MHTQQHGMLEGSNKQSLFSTRKRKGFSSIPYIVSPVVWISSSEYILQNTLVKCWTPFHFAYCAPFRLNSHMANVTCRFAHIEPAIEHCNGQEDEIFQVVIWAYYRFSNPQHACSLVDFLHLQCSRGEIMGNPHVVDFATINGYSFSGTLGRLLPMPAFKAFWPILITISCIC